MKIATRLRSYNDVQSERRLKRFLRNSVQLLIRGTTMQAAFGAVRFNCRFVIISMTILADVGSATRRIGMPASFCSRATKISKSFSIIRLCELISATRIGPSNRDSAVNVSPFSSAKA